MFIDSAMKQLEDVISFFEKYRNDGFATSLTIAKSLASDMNIEPVFSTKRRIFRKKNNLMRKKMMKFHYHRKNLLELIIL